MSWRPGLPGPREQWLRRIIPSPLWSSSASAWRGDGGAREIEIRRDCWEDRWRSLSERGPFRDGPLDESTITSLAHHAPIRNNLLAADQRMLDCASDLLAFINRKPGT